MDELFCYIEKNEDCQFTLIELVEVITNDFIPNPNTITYTLTALYKKYIKYLNTKHFKSTIICFLTTQNYF